MSGEGFFKDEGQNNPLPGDWWKIDKMCSSRQPLPAISKHMKVPDTVLTRLRIPVTSLRVGTVRPCPLKGNVFPPSGVKR